MYEQNIISTKVKEWINSYDYTTGQLALNYNITALEVENLIKKINDIDYRYDAFIASLLAPKESTFEFPEHVNIITWNYDSQIELAFQQFCNKSIFDVQRKLGVYPIEGLNENHEHVKQLSDVKFKVLHLNGIASYL